MLTLYITRHGETEWNKEERMQGWQDSPLTENGKNAAALLSNRLENVSFDAIYSSPSKRAHDTAKILCGQHNLPITLKDDLKEIHMGEWEGETRSHLREVYAEQFYHFWNKPHHYVPANGETFEELAERLTAFLQQLASEHPSGNVLIVSHGITIAMLRLIMESGKIEHLWNSPVIHGASLTVVERKEENYHIILEGDTAHFKIECMQ